MYGQLHHLALALTPQNMIIFGFMYEKESKHVINYFPVENTFNKISYAGKKTM